jgi:DNA polymerase-3 subunit delta'
MAKVAIVHEADRMNLNAANSFLKTLEEPPAHTTLILVTTHPYVLLPTIRSRCLHFRFPADRSVEADAQAEGWSDWVADYGAWLGRVSGGSSQAGDKREVADHVFSVYGLVARFDQILEKATAAAWEKQRAGLPEDLGDDAQVAIETGLANGIRARFFADVEAATEAHARARLAAADPAARRMYSSAIRTLEHGAYLLRLNLNESAVLEDFLLASLRLWSGRPA